MRFLYFAIILNALCVPSVHAQSASDPSVLTSLRADYDAHIEDLYRHFHANPEISLMESRTAERMAVEFRIAGFEVHTGIGGHGVVAVLENGAGPTVMLRADMDGLPMQERTGLEYASTITMENEMGVSVPVMHACAHDTHMAALVGAARWFSDHRDDWSGRLVLIAQPAEEIGQGAASMLEDGLYDQFGVPDAVLAFHAFGGIPAGDIRYAPGFAMAGVDSVDLYIHGVGAHGATPHFGKDPIVLASQIITGLQTVVSRELSPFEPGVITVGMINAGTTYNIIPDQAHLKLTVRSYSDNTRQLLLSGIERIATNTAAAAGLVDELAPRIEVAEGYIPSLYNDPALSQQAYQALRQRFGDRVAESAPITAGEDFTHFGRTDHDVPVFLFWVGATPPEVFEQAQQSGSAIPGNHSPFFAPDPEPTITTGSEGLVIIARDIFDHGLSQ